MIFFVVEFGRLKALNVNVSVRLDLFTSQYSIAARVNKALDLMAVVFFELRVELRYCLHGANPLPLVEVGFTVRVEQKSTNDVIRSL